MNLQRGLCGLLVLAMNGMHSSWAGDASFEWSAPGGDESERHFSALQEINAANVAQLKLAWWRDRMRTAAAQWPQGEPLLAALAPFDAERAALEGLIDAWEGLIGDEAGEDETARLVKARASAVAAVARLSGCPVDEIALEPLARRWTMPDISQPEAVRLPRALRPLVILANLPRSSDAGPLALLRIVRLGLLGR